MIIDNNDPASFYLGTVNKMQAIQFLENKLGYLDSSYQLIFDVPQVEESEKHLDSNDSEWNGHIFKNSGPIARVVRMDVLDELMNELEPIDLSLIGSYGFTLNGSWGASMTLARCYPFRERSLSWGSKENFRAWCHQLPAEKLRRLYLGVQAIDEELRPAAFKEKLSRQYSNLKAAFLARASVDEAQKESLAKDREQILEVVRDILKSKDVSNFQLPHVEGKKNHHIVGVSGGMDSTALALTLVALYPDQEFDFLFTDTKAESPDLYKRLDLLDEVLPKPIIRIGQPFGLHEYIDHYGGFIPSVKSRFCTSYLKIKCMDDYLDSTYDYDKDSIHTFVGLRSDENRFGYISSNDSVNSHYPFVKMDVGQKDVFDIVSKTLGMPKDYKWRSRSGCETCFFQSQSENIQLFARNKKAFNRAKEQEKFSPSDLQRFDLLASNLRANTDGISDSVDYKVPFYPIPSFADNRVTSNSEIKSSPVTDKSADQLDIFSAEITDHKELGSYYVAVAYLSDEHMKLFDTNSSGVYSQHFITFSSSRNGLNNSLNHYYNFRANTAEVWNETPETLKANLSIAMYQIQAPKELIDLKSPAKGSYTWRNGISYHQLEHHFKLAHLLLCKAGLEQAISDKTISLENIALYKKQYAMLDGLPGKITWCQKFHPRVDFSAKAIRAEQDALPGMESGANVSSKKEPDPEQRDRACVICSI